MRALFLKDSCKIQKSSGEKNLTVNIPISNSFVLTKNAREKVDFQRNSFSVSLFFWWKKLITFQHYFSSFPEESVKIFLLNILSQISCAAASAPFPSEMKVSDLNGENGFAVLGNAFSDSTGAAFASGDFNQDGFNDWLVSSPGVSSGSKVAAGETSLIWGREGNWSSSVALLNITGVTFRGISSGDRSGTYIISCDLNGDGIPEIVISAPYASPLNRLMAGEIYVIKGHSGVWNSTIDLSQLDGQNGFTIYGINPSDLTGNTLACVDINSFRKALLIGTGNYQPNGASFLVYSTSAWNKTLDLSTNGVIILGENPGDMAGFAVANIGDMNRDGRAAFAIGAPGYTQGIGAAYIIFDGNNLSATFSLSELNGQNGYKLLGIPSGSGFGSALTELHNFYADSKVSLAIGAPGSNSFPNTCFVAVWNLQTPFLNQPIHLLSETNNSIIFAGENKGDLCGFAVADLGSFNGGKYSSLIIGAPGVSHLRGGAYVVFGQETFWNSTISLSALGNKGLKINGTNPGDLLGKTVGDLSYFNKVDFHNLALGAPGAKNTAGSAYVLFGLSSPELAANRMEILQGKPLVLSSQNFAALYLNVSLPTLIFEIRGLHNGYFARRNQTQTALSWFYQSEIAAEQILFLPDGGRYSPLCEISVLNQFSRSAYQPCQINFYSKPKLSCDVLSINQNQTITLTSQNFNATDSRTKMSEILLNITDVQNGYFIVNGYKMPSSFLMNQSDVMQLLVQFSQNGSGNAPFYFLSAINAKGLIDGPVSCVSNFWSLPRFEENAITINQGQSHLLSSKDLNVTDARTPFYNLQFIITDIQHGNFSNTSYVLREPVSFKQSDVAKNEISFLHDGSLHPPAYIITVFNQRGLTAQSRAVVDFWLIPQFTEKHLTIQQGGTAGLTANNLNVTDFKSQSSHLLYRIFDISHSCLKKLPGLVCIQEFLQSDVDSGLLQLTHDGTSNSPILSLIASNNHTKTLPVKMDIQFVLNSNTLFLQWLIPILISVIVLSLICIARKIIIGRKSSQGYTVIGQVTRDNEDINNNDGLKKVAANNTSYFSQIKSSFFFCQSQQDNVEEKAEMVPLNTSSVPRYGT